MNDATGEFRACRVVRYAAGCVRQTVLLTAVAGLAVAPLAAQGEMPCCSGSGCCVGMWGAVCTLAYGASGTVSDTVTGMPIAGARITVLDVSATSAADGTFTASGARGDTCNIDYFYAISVTATGYALYHDEFYTSWPYSAALHLQLVPLQTPTPTVCPVETPCPLGERPHPCTPDACGLGCGCESCPPCGDGEVPAHQFNSCRCIPGSGEPTATPTPPAATPTASATVTPTPVEIACGAVCDSRPCTRHCLDGFIASGVCTLTVTDTNGDPIGCGCAASCTHGCAPDCAAVCVGDCDRNGAVTVEELVTMVDIGLGTANIFSSCPAADTDGDLAVDVSEILVAVNRALGGCAGPEPGYCYESSACDPSATYPSAPFSTNRGRCCELQRTEGGAPFTWCPGAAFDPVTHSCSSCLNPC